MSLHDAALVINGLCMGWLLALAVHLIAQDRADRRAEERARAVRVFTEVRENPAELGGRPSKTVHLSRAACCNQKEYR